VGERQLREFAIDTVTLWIIPWAFVFTLAVVTAIGIVTWHRTQPSRQEWREHRRRERELVDDYRRQRSGT
jgi:Tfp pilus assembly protein PilO